VANERILVVDDEKGVVRSCVRILERYGYTVSGQTDSQAVPELLKRESFDLLLTDIKMPRIDGLTLLRIARQIDPHLTVVLITGYGTMEDAINAIRLGAEGFLMKPFEPEDLVNTIKENLAHRSLIRDSLRLQTLLPLLEINQSLQVSGGETSLIRQVLKISQRETGAARIAWLSCQPPSLLPFEKVKNYKLRELAVVPLNSKTDEPESPQSWLPQEALDTALNRARPVWVLADGSLTDNIIGQPNIAGALLPLMIKGEVVGVLTAETSRAEGTGIFNPISLDLLSVLAGQLAIIIENVQLFQQTETLRILNEDIIQNMTNGLIAIDQDNFITAFNPAAARMIGYPPDKALYQSIQKVMIDTQELIKIFSKTLSSGEALARQEVTVYHQDGTCLPISISTAPLLPGNGHKDPVGVVGVLEDLSEVKALEERRRRLDRLAALGEMSAVVAHEIRNPMAGIAAGIEYLTRNIGPDSPDYPGLAMIRGEIERVNRILEDILFVARPMRLNLSEENLSEIIKSVVQRCQPQLKESQIVVSLQQEENLPLLPVDRQRLEQVFTNLIINATQAITGQGELLLQTYTNSNRNERGIKEVVITVADTGPGIPAGTQQRIFEPFFTTKTKGTGLGLPVARRIIEEHGGTISIKSEEGQGTQFIITLPLP
jgi:PAS domain S-box-containing protein